MVLENGAFTSSPAPMLQAVAFSDKVILLNVVNPSVVEEKHNLIKSFGNTQGYTGGGDKNASSGPAKHSLKGAALPSDLEPYGTSTTTLGGLFTLGVIDNETTTQTVKIKAESRAIKDINDVTGVLFPLEVGNSLSFSYVFLNESEKSGVTFVVKTKTPAKLFSKDYTDMQDLGLIGDIYVISREIKSAASNSLAGSCDLYYSDELSYVIGSTCADKRSWVKSFKLDKLGESYREEIAAANKASEQEEIDAKVQISAQLSPEMRMKAKEKFSQAFHLFQEGEFEAAVIRFNQALEIDPANGLGHYFWPRRMFASMMLKMRWNIIVTRFYFLQTLKKPQLLKSNCLK
ncbi:MAG: hypothetical protein WDM70_06595 [Nitrosomonadales bacterium]